MALKYLIINSTIYNDTFAQFDKIFLLHFIFSTFLLFYMPSIKYIMIKSEPFLQTILDRGDESSEPSCPCRRHPVLEVPDQGPILRSSFSAEIVFGQTYVL
jgi:hypothetical protein